MIQESVFEVIQETLNQLRPAILRDGGNIELVRYENGVVFVRLLGACINCPASFFTLKLGVEQAIKQRLPEVKEVVALDSDEL